MRKESERLDYRKLLKNKEVKAFLKKGNENLGVLGYTEHSEKHCAIVARRAGMILKKLGYSEHEVELAQIAGAMHDVGNAINRKNHGEYGGMLAYHILEKEGIALEDRIQIASAIGNHDESTGGAVDAISAALILADKTDVRREEKEALKVLTEYSPKLLKSMRNVMEDKHDRANYAVTNATVKLNLEKKVITLNLQVDEEICSMCEYFEIFLGRMLMCRRASELLGMKFKLTANGSKVL